jgi:hypothetical protein
LLKVVAYSNHLLIRPSRPQNLAQVTTSNKKSSILSSQVNSQFALTLIIALLHLSLA